MNEDEQSGHSILVSAIAACGLALLVALTAPLWSGPVQNWLGPLTDWLTRVPSANQTPQAPAAIWSDKEIEAALMQCVRALAPITADVSPLGPLRSGDCGSPAPVLLKSIGATDKVAFDPPLVLNCAMVVGLERWLRETVQPAAKETFSSPVSKIVGSSYACRNIYNLPNGKLSQHAFANAVDLPMFVFADGLKVDITHGWGVTRRDLIAAAKANKAASGITGAVGEQKTERKDSATDVVKVSTSPAASSETSADQGDPKAVAKSKFLRRVHDGGCTIFSTVLGPEANDVHRTHLHLDLQERTASVCE